MSEKIKMGKRIDMREIVNFCDAYNSIGFGKAYITELKTKFIVKLYNAGYSENEEMDYEFQKRYKTNIILDYHPITIAEFSKLDLIYNTHVVNFKGIETWTDCYKKQDSFTYTLEIN